MVQFCMKIIKRVICYLLFTVFFLLFVNIPLIHSKADKDNSTGNTTIILVRHAEKASEDKDPELTDDGKARALELKYILKHVKLDAVYSTDFKRTRETVDTVAKSKGLPVLIYDHKNNDFINTVIKKHRGGKILISGHSNSTPHQINLITGKKTFNKLDEKIYDNIFIVTITKAKEISILRLRFGKHTPE